MAGKDDLDSLIDEFAEDDPGIHARVAAALDRRQLARQLAARRKEAGLTQSEVAERMGTSQGQIARFESGADTRLSTVARYAATVGLNVGWNLEPSPTVRTLRGRKTSAAKTVGAVNARRATARRAASRNGKLTA